MHRATAKRVMSLEGDGRMIEAVIGHEEAPISKFLRGRWFVNDSFGRGALPHASKTDQRDVFIVDSKVCQLCYEILTSIKHGGTW